MTNVGREEARRRGVPLQHLIAKWKKQSRRGDAPIFQLLARAIASDIRSGEVASGSKLPTHRSLALQLGITVSTASRAYSEIRRVGLIEAGVGRGTYVRNLHAATPEAGEKGPADLRFHGVPTAAYANEMARTLLDAAPELSEHRTMGRTDYTVSESWARAGAKWLAEHCNLAVEPDVIVVTGGIQQSLVSALLAVAPPRGTLVTEKLTYGGVKAAAAALHLNLVGVEIDEHGIVPEALDAVCRRHRPAALICVPTLHNPTVATMTLERRRRIVEIARWHELAIVEDDAYAAYDEDALPSLHALYPERSILLTSLSKPISPNLRVGFATAQPPVLERLSAIVRATGATPQPLAAEIAARWIANGTADAIFGANAAELVARNAVFAERLTAGRMRSHRRGPHVWLELPPAWRVEDFMAAAQKQGIAVLPAGAFALGGTEAFHAVRISLSAAASRAQVGRVGDELASILQSALLAQVEVGF